MSTVPPPSGRPPRTLALGAWLATRGPIAALGFALAAIGSAAAIVGAFAAARRGGPATQIATWTAEGIAWGAGMTLAFGAAFRAIERDREQGVVSLVRARGVSVAAYVRGRVTGLSLLLAAVVGGATLVAGLAATSIDGPSVAVLRAWLGALAYALAFAATIGPVALASLGTGGRAGGYLALLTVLALPELAAPWTSTLLPRDWHELTSIPAALDAVRAGVCAPLHQGASAARALAALAAVVAVSVVVVDARVARGAEHAE